MLAIDDFVISDFQLPIADLWWRTTTVAAKSRWAKNSITEARDLHAATNRHLAIGNRDIVNPQFQNRESPIVNPFDFPRHLVESRVR